MIDWFCRVKSKNRACCNLCHSGISTTFKTSQVLHYSLYCTRRWNKVVLAPYFMTYAKKNVLCFCSANFLYTNRVEHGVWHAFGKYRTYNCWNIKHYSTPLLVYSTLSAHSLILLPSAAFFLSFSA